jgi:hypothetical protein
VADAVAAIAMVQICFRKKFKESTLSLMLVGGLSMLAPLLAVMRLMVNVFNNYWYCGSIGLSFWFTHRTRYFDFVETKPIINFWA